MSKYPENPYWDQQYDQPKLIVSRHVWEVAAAGGHITPEHVMFRLKSILDHSFENQGAMGFDENGFVISLIAEGLRQPDGVTLVVHSNDHPPPHVHIKLRSHPGAKLRIRLDNAELMDDLPKGLSTKKLASFRAAILENRAVLEEWWNSYHGIPIRFA